MIASRAWQAEAAKRKLPQKLEVLDIPQDDAWFRDSGPSVRAAASSRAEMTLSVDGSRCLCNSMHADKHHLPITAGSESTAFTAKHSSCFILSTS